MKITKHMQSCFLVETNGTKILVDSGTYVFNEEGLSIDDFRDINAIVVTHEHSDHFDIDNVLEIAKRDSSKIFAPAPVIEMVKSSNQNIECEELKDGFAGEINNVRIEGYSQEHGPLPVDKPAPLDAGAVIDDGKARFYTPGDSIYLNEGTDADVIGTPICGQVVMNIETAKSELLKLMPKVSIPMHYDNDRYPVNVDDFVAAMEGTGIEVKVLKNGESIEL